MLSKVNCTGTLQKNEKHISDLLSIWLFVGILSFLCFFMCPSSALECNWMKPWFYFPPACRSSRHSGWVPSILNWFPETDARKWGSSSVWGWNCSSCMFPWVSSSCPHSCTGSCGSFTTSHKLHSAALNLEILVTFMNASFQYFTQIYINKD